MATQTVELVESEKKSLWAEIGEAQVQILENLETEAQCRLLVEDGIANAIQPHVNELKELIDANVPKLKDAPAEETIGEFKQAQKAGRAVVTKSGLRKTINALKKEFPEKGEVSFMQKFGDQMIPRTLKACDVVATGLYARVLVGKAHATQDRNLSALGYKRPEVPKLLADLIGQ